MGYTEYAADPRLSDWVKCFWSIADDPSDTVQEVWPDGCVELCFTRGNIVKIEEDGRERRFPPVFVLGLQTGIVRVRAEGDVRLFAARLLPLGPRSWEEEQLSELATRVEPCLDSLEFRTAVRLVEDWLLLQPREDDELARALRRIYAADGSVSVDALSAADGITARQLQRIFAARLGLSPKTVAKVVRFAAGWSRLLSKPDLSLAELALDLGYADQPHFTNDFKTFSGRSPGEFQKELQKE